jgi:uncharacterized membrane protein
MTDTDPAPTGWPQRFRRHLLGKMLSGLLILVPFIVAVFFLRFAVNLLSSIVAPLATFVDPFGVPRYVITAVSVIVLLVLLYLCGVVTANSLGRKLVGLSEAIFMRVPLLKTVYKSTKTALIAMTMTRRARFRSVVMMQFPKMGFWSLGFVTGSTVDRDGNEYLKVFCPTAPNPTTGFFVILSESEAVDTNLTVEEGIQSIVTGGILFPRELPIDPAITLSSLMQKQSPPGGTEPT